MKSVWVQKDAELVFHWDDGSERFYVTAFQVGWVGKVAGKVLAIARSWVGG